MGRGKSKTLRSTAMGLGTSATKPGVSRIKIGDRLAVAEATASELGQRASYYLGSDSLRLAEPFQS